jgi:hypothetical protein
VHNGVVAIKQPIATIELTDSLTHVSPLYLCARNVSIALCSIFVGFALESKPPTLLKFLLVALGLII